MTAKLSEELQKAIDTQGGTPVEVEDPQTHKKYVLIEQSVHERAMKALQQQENIAAIHAGIDAAEQGRVSTLDEVDARIRKKFGLNPQA